MIELFILDGLPNQVVAIDWSSDSSKRWMARAFRSVSGVYHVYPPEPVGDSATLLRRLREQSPDDGRVLVGFDFPIGLPAAYARGVGIATFRKALKEFGQSAWEDFYEVSETPSRHQPFYPMPTQERGRCSKVALSNALGMQWHELLRRCDHATRTRGSAECLFWTLGGKQVGRAAISGWRDVLVPALDSIWLWPFDGGFDDLLQKSGVTVVEIYPAEACCHLNVRIGAGTGRSKRRRDDRRSFAPNLLACAGNQIEISDPARSWIEWGFLDEDDFDAMVALLSMLLIVTGKRQPQVPDDVSVREIEGWILGLDAADLLKTQN